MESLTQKSISFDKVDKFQQDEEINSLLSKEKALIKDLEDLAELTKSTQSDLTDVRRKLRIYKKKAGLNKTTSRLICDYVQNNPGKKFSEIQKYLQSIGIVGSSGSRITQTKELGLIVEQEDGTHIPGGIFKNSYGSVVSLMMEFANQVDWFMIRECNVYVMSKRITSRSTIQSLFSNPAYRDRFEVDRTSGKYIKYRLKDEYRRK